MNSKIMAVLLTSFLLLSMFSVISAEENETTEEIGTELTDEEVDASLEEIETVEAGSDTALENAFDRFRLAFIFNKEKKIERTLEMADERLAEAEAMAEEDPERAEKARERYEHFVEKAEKTMEKLEAAKLNNVNIEDRMGEFARSQNRIEAHRERAEAVHARILNKFIERNESEEKIERIEEIFGKFADRSRLTEERANQRRENFDTKLKVIAGMNDEELQEFVGNIEQEQGLKQAREIREQRRKAIDAKFERSQEKNVKLVEKQRQRLETSNLSEGQKNELRKRLDTIEQRAEQKRSLALKKLQEQSKFAKPNL